MRQIFEDLRHSIRSLKAKPGLTTMVVLSLGLGIGANTMLFTVVNGLLLQPLPFDRVDELAEISQTRAGLPIHELNRARSFNGVAAFIPRNFEVFGSDETKYVFGVRASANLFSVLGIHAAIGRLFAAGEEPQPVMVLSYQYWTQISGDPKIVGQTLTVDNEKRTIIGVLPPDFALQVRGAGIFIPYVMRDGRVIARLKPGVSTDQAEADVAGILTALGAKRDRDSAISVRPITKTFRPNDAAPYVLLQAAVGLVLLITCANVANLLLVRSTARRREFAIRTAIGAGRARLLRQLLMESALMAIAGGALGLLLASWGVVFLRTWLPGNVTRLLRGADALAIDHRVLSFTLGVSLLIVLLFGLAPALQTVKFDLISSLRDSSKGSSPDRQRFGQMLVTAEVALSLMLLIGSGLTLKSLIGLQKQYLGFSGDHVLRAAVEYPASRYPRPEQRAAMLTETVRRLSVLPGVEMIGVLAPQFFPFGGPFVRGAPFEIKGHADIQPRAERYTASPDYFHSVRIPLLSGRWFTDTDTATSLPVALISNVVAKRYWSGANPVGQSIRFSLDSPWATVIGVVGDVRNPLGLDVQPLAYCPLAQIATSGGVLMIRTATDPLALSGAVRKELHAIDPAAPDARVASLEKAVSEYITAQRFIASILGVFAALGLLLAALGIYGVIRYWVSTRVPEIGLRVALGAQRSDILKLVIGKAAQTILTGIVLGLAGAVALQKLIASQLYGISPTDPTVFLFVSASMAAVALLAAFLPARWASKIDPQIALRHE